MIYNRALAERMAHLRDLVISASVHHVALGIIVEMKMQQVLLGIVREAIGAIQVSIKRNLMEVIRLLH